MPGNSPPLHQTLKQRAQVLIDLLAEDPWRSPPPFEALVGDLRGAYSRRINIQHRLVYSVEADQQLVKVLAPVEPLRPTS